jgi:hypothetical protein
MNWFVGEQMYVVALFYKRLNPTSRVDAIGVGNIAKFHRKRVETW